MTYCSECGSNFNAQLQDEGWKRDDDDDEEDDEEAEAPNVEAANQAVTELEEKLRSLGVMSERNLQKLCDFIFSEIREHAKETKTQTSST